MFFFHSSIGAFIWKSRVNSSFRFLGCKDAEFDTYDDVILHLVKEHKICRKFYDASQIHQQEVEDPAPKQKIEPEVIGKLQNFTARG